MSEHSWEFWKFGRVLYLNIYAKLDVDSEHDNEDASADDVVNDYTLALNVRQTFKN